MYGQIALIFGELRSAQKRLGTTSNWRPESNSLTSPINTIFQEALKNVLKINKKYI